MYCPRCGHRQKCGCKSCFKRRPIRKFVQRIINGPFWYWSTPSDIACGKCHLTRNASWWEDIDWNVHKENYK